MYKLSLYLCLCALTLLTTAEAQIYKWTDASGTLHISDTPPQQPGIKPEKIKLPEQTEKSGDVQPGIREGEAKMLDEFEQKRKQKASASIENSKGDDDQRAAKCQEYKLRYESINSPTKRKEMIRAGDRQLNKDSYYRYKLNEYRTKMKEYCD